MYKSIEQCRACGSTHFQQVLNLGEQYVVDFVKPDADRSQCTKAPLELVMCCHCKLVQLQHSVEPDRLYKKFWYRSGINEQMREALKDIVQWSQYLTEFEPGDRVLDIGCNDGTMLDMFDTKFRKVGIDPCRDLIEEAHTKQRGDAFVADYFSARAVMRWAPFKIITAVAMFYDLEDPTDFLRQCKSVLAQDGLLVIQFNYLKSMLEQMAIDNICHEHLTYFSLLSLTPVVEKVGLEIEGVQTNDVNGGSIRIFLKHVGEPIKTARVSADARFAMYSKYMTLMRDEEMAGLGEPETYALFGSRARAIIEALRSYLTVSNKMNEKTFVYGASTRGSTLLQAISPQHGEILGAAERDPKKCGLSTVGTWLPIMSEASARDIATQFLVLPWHFWDSIKKRENAWLVSGGKFILPLPMPRVITADSEFDLLTSSMRSAV